MFRTIVNVTTGEAQQVPLTPAEITAISAQQPEPTAASVCSPWQIRKALNRIGLRGEVETLVAESTDQDLKDGWLHAPTFRSDDSFVLSIGALIGMSAEQTRDYVQWASTL